MAILLIYLSSFVQCCGLQTNCTVPKYCTGMRFKRGICFCYFTA